jgi:hypothetical protein
MESTSTSNLFELQIDQTATVYLRDAARWAKFLAVAGFVFCALFIVVAILAVTLLSSLFNSMGVSSPGLAGMGGGVVAFVYIGIALVNFFPCLYLYNFAARAQQALRNNDQEQLIASLRNMRAFYRFVGVLMIICLGLWVLFVVILVIGAAARPIS